MEVVATDSLVAGGVVVAADGEEVVKGGEIVVAATGSTGSTDFAVLV